MMLSTVSASLPSPFGAAGCASSAGAVTNGARRTTERLNMCIVLSGNLLAHRCEPYEGSGRPIARFRPKVPGLTFLESTVMRLDQQIRAAAARPALMGAAALLFVSGLPLSASGQARPAQPPAAAAAPVVQGTPLSI